MSILIHRGFSLLELIAVLTITGVLAITVIPRFEFNNNDLLDSKSTVMNALRHTREMALARAQTNTSIRLIVSSTTVDVREGGDSVQFPDAYYPVQLPSDIIILRGQGIFIFDQLGNSTQSEIEISDGDSSEIITLTGGGYAF